MKRPARTWAMLAALGLPLIIVGVAAMMISFATLIDVARINGLPFPTMFPILIDVGMVQSMIVASQFKLRDIRGRWLAYLTFVALSIVSIGANSTHALTTADMTITAPLWAGLVAATPPATLLATTHLVMMLIPDAKERQRLQTIREKQSTAASVTSPLPKSQAKPVATPSAPQQDAQTPQPRTKQTPNTGEETPRLAIVQSASSNATDEEVTERVLEFIRVEGTKPTGKVVGEWLGGKSAKTGQRFLAKLEERGTFTDRISTTLHA